MSIQDSEERLFAEWAPKRPGFVKDGVADEEAYLASSPKLLFILKEVNDPRGGGWDLREFILEGARAQTWSNIARWVEGIRRLPDDLPWAEVQDVDADRRRRALRSITAVNLKKSPGGHTTDAAELSATAAEDKAFINRQFALYDAELVICCGAHTSNTFHALVQAASSPEWRVTRRGIRYHEIGPKRLVVAFAHPEARCADCLLYYGLVDALREILHGAA